MVFFFTGTGNSMYAAKQLEDAAVSIPQVIHDTNLRFHDERIGIVAPVYGHELPDMVNEFIRKAEFDTEYLYCIATYGSGHSGAGVWMQSLFEKAGKKLNYANVILMPDNYLPGFDMDQEKRREGALDIEGQVARIRDDIMQMKDYILPAGMMERFMHGQAVAMKHRVVTDQFIQNLYSITDSCVGCGVCTKVCPAGCFSVEDGLAHQDPTGCQMCMACIHACPQNAIRLNMNEPHPGAHYRNSHVNLAEITAANDQHKGNR